MKRRQFIKQICNACVVSTLPASLVALQSCSNPNSSEDSSRLDTLDIDLSDSKFALLKEIGGSVAIGNNNFDTAGLIVIRKSEMSYAAFSRRCPHAGTSINNFSSGVAICPNHGAKFDTNGSPISGPTNANLKNYTCSVNGSLLTVSK